MGVGIGVGVGDELGDGLGLDEGVGVIGWLTVKVPVTMFMPSVLIHL